MILKVFAAKAIYSALSLTAVWSTIFPSAPVADPDRIQQSVVLIGISFSASIQQPATGEWTQPITINATCTGFVVDHDGHVMTADHCVNQRKARNAILAQYIGVPGIGDQEIEDILGDVQVKDLDSGKPVSIALRVIQPYGEHNDGLAIEDSVPAVLVDSRVEGDQALLQIPGYKDALSPLPVATAPVRQADTVYAVGYPALAGADSIGPYVFSQGTVLSTPDDSLDTRTNISAAMWKGMSGGPIVNRRGEVVGLVSQTLAANAMFGFVTSREDIVAFLEDKGIATTAVAEPNPWKGIALVLVAAGTGALLLATGVWWVLQYRNTRRLAAA